MASLDTLPPDQRAVLELVLKRGRGYDEIARLLSVDRAGVRERALAAFDALGPPTRVPRERRTLITDYLLGQLPPRVSDATRERLAHSAGERAWARVLASELAPFSSTALPEIPADAGGRDAEPVAAGGSGEPEPVAAAGSRERDPMAAAGSREPEPVAAAGSREPDPMAAAAAQPAADRQAGSAAAPDADGAGEQRGLTGRPSSRRGGIILLTLGALVVVGVVVAIIALTGGSANKKNTSTSASQHAATTTTPASTSTTSTTSTNGAHLVVQINMISPHRGSKAVGVALVLRQGKNTGVAIRAQNLPANGKHDAYAVWLYKSATDSHILGFVNPSVGSNGVLQAESGLPANAGHFTQLLITRETQQNPRQPGAIVLKGPLKGL
jgi:hypothetical protein